MLLVDFRSIRPPFETAQADGLEWFVEAHTQAEKTKGMGEKEAEAFRSALKEKLWRVGCKPDRIAKRGHVLPDFLHRDWEKMEVYRLTESASGRDLSVRTKCFEHHVDLVFEQYYPEGSTAPDDLIHVSCTGYISPSGAQKIASKRGWGQQTTITHAYHMGCYGSLPAIRMAKGFLLSDREKKRADIVHTELCCLHTNPTLHESNQLVSQSLFADGFIRYSVARDAKQPHLRVSALLEEIVPQSTKAMTWDVAEWGFKMFLSKEIPVLIARSLSGYLKRLCKKGCVSEDAVLRKALFAIHPGGPKILLQIQELLGLSDRQMAHSFQILKAYGNMSSATLPHIWEAILADEGVEDKTVLVSLAFGPGLSIAGSLLEKRCGS